MLSDSCQPIDMAANRGASHIVDMDCCDRSSIGSSEVVAQSLTRRLPFLNDDYEEKVESDLSSLISDTRPAQKNLRDPLKAPPSFSDTSRRDSHSIRVMR